MPNSRNLVRTVSTVVALASALGFSLSALRMVSTGTAVATIPAATVAAASGSAVAATPDQNVSTAVPRCEAEPPKAINPNGIEAAMIQLIAHRARLEAELGEAEQINLPQEFRGHENNELVTRAMDEEQRAFETRKQQVASELNSAQENIAALKDERNIAEAKKTIVERQAAMLHNQLDSVDDLLRRGLSTNAQKLAIEQNLAQYESARLDMQLLALKSQQEWMKTEQHVVDLRNQVKMADWVEFNQTQQKLAELSRQASAQPRAEAGQRPEGPCRQDPENPGDARPLVTASNEGVNSPRNEMTRPSATAIPPSPPADSHFEPKRPDVQGRQDDGPPPPPAAPAPEVRSDAAGSCKLDRARLAQLRADPNREEVARFARELSCEELRPQVTRLLEMTAGPSGLAGRADTNDSQGSRGDHPADGHKALASPAKADSGQVCKLAQARLAQLRADPNREEVARFARELSCEELRPQVTRLLESLGVSLSVGQELPRPATPKGA